MRHIFLENKIKATASQFKEIIESQTIMKETTTLYTEIVIMEKKSARFEDSQMGHKVRCA